MKLAEAKTEFTRRTHFPARKQFASVVVTGGVGGRRMASTTDWLWVLENIAEEWDKDKTKPAPAPQPQPTPTPTEPPSEEQVLASAIAQVSEEVAAVLIRGVLALDRKGWYRRLAKCLHPDTTGMDGSKFRLLNDLYDREGGDRLTVVEVDVSESGWTTGYTTAKTQWTREQEEEVRAWEQYNPSGSEWYGSPPSEGELRHMRKARLEWEAKPAHERAKHRAKVAELRKKADERYRKSKEDIFGDIDHSTPEEEEQEHADLRAKAEEAYKKWAERDLDDVPF